MNTVEISQMEKFEKTYWWHVGKKNLVKHLIDTYIKPNTNITDTLEIGCGAGEITTMLTAYGNVVGIDISKEAIEVCKKRGLKNLLLGDVNQLDLSAYKEKFDVILALDVLEHIQDDVTALKHIHDMLKPKGYVIISVPAYKFLWSQHDEALEHKRRYTTYELTRKVMDTNFHILKNSHFVFFSFPIIAVFKFLSNFFSKEAYPKSSYVEVSDTINSFMIKVLQFETLLIDKIRLPFGTTINILAQKD